MSPERGQWTAEKSPPCEQRGRGNGKRGDRGNIMVLAIGITAAAAIVFGIALLADKLPERIMEKLMKILK